jgi:hypothetical protein
MRSIILVDKTMRHMSVGLALGLGSCVNLAAAPAKVQASSDTVRLVEYFLKTETVDLVPGAVPKFMEVDPESLPSKLRKPYLVKKEELLALKKIADGRKKPPLRLLTESPMDSCEPEKGTEQTVGIYRLAGYANISEDEEVHLMRQTSCTECELMSEFSLKILLLPPKKKEGKPQRVLMLHDKDPLWTLVGAYRQGRENPFGTNFFGLGHPKCR